MKSMGKVRQPAVAGRFYPGDPDELRRDVVAYLEEGEPPSPDDLPGPPCGLIVPHAGYVFSGPVAGSAYRLVRDGDWRRALIIGPAHRYPVPGLALPDCAALRTPLGDLPVDADGVAALSELSLVEVNDAAHAAEHSIEVQLPFLQVCCDGIAVVPLAAGMCGPEPVAEAIEALWDDGTLLVISTDLSHFETYESARSQDARTIEAIRTGHLRDLDGHDACGHVGVAGALIESHRRGRTPVLLDYRNSGDTLGDKSRVVGYAAFAIC